MNLAFRDIAHNRGRFLLTCLGLSLLLGIVLAMVGIYRGLVAEALTLARSPGAHLWVVEAETRGPFAEASRIPGDARESIARVAGIVEAGAVTYQSIDISRGGMGLRAYLVGHEPGRIGGPPTLAAGRNVVSTRFEIVADRGTGLSIGDRLPLGRDSYEVVGLTRNQVSSGGDPVIFMALRNAQRLQFELAPPAARKELTRGWGTASSDIVNAILARVSDNAQPGRVAAAIRQWKHLAVLTQAEQETLLGKSVIERARRQIGLFTSLLLIVSTVVIALIIYTLTLDKLKEIATLKLIGAPDRTIVALIVQQALAMGTIGFAAGASLVYLFQDRFPRRVIIDPADVAGLALVVVVVCIAASALGVRLALRVEPAAALGG